MGPFFPPSASYTDLRETRMVDLTVSCQHCGKPFQATLGRARFCGAPCRWAAWKLEREKKARAPLERILAGLPARLEELAQEIREALGGQNRG